MRNEVGMSQVVIHTQSRSLSAVVVAGNLKDIYTVPIVKCEISRVCYVQQCTVTIRLNPLNLKLEMLMIDGSSLVSDVALFPQTRNFASLCLSSPISITRS